MKIKPWLLITFFTIALSAPAFALQYPSEWIHFLAPMTDSRVNLPAGSPVHSSIEIAEVPYQGETDKLGTILMVPGFFQNGNSFDLLPEQGISFARYVSKTFRLQVYLLHVRGLGQSSSAKRLNLDDFAIDDLPAAIDWLAEREHSKIIVFGNSQGGIMLQASLAGLSRCSHGNCFRAEVAARRQAKVSGLAISGGSVSMTHQKNFYFFPALLQLYRVLAYPVKHTLDYINIYTLSQNPILEPLASFPLWSFLYLRKNVTPEAEVAMLERTVEATWAGVMLQFGAGIEKHGIRTQGRGLASLPYVSGFKNISVPVTQVTYEVDPFAEPELTQQDSYAYIGSKKKRFFTFADQSHEDYLMSSGLHHDWDQPLSWLINQKD